MEQKVSKRKSKEDYKMLQLDANMHQALKEYCNQHGFIMKSFVQSLIRQALSNNKRK